MNGGTIIQKGPSCEQVKRNEGDGEAQPLYEGGGTMVCKDDFQIGHKQSSSSGSV